MKRTLAKVKDLERFVRKHGEDVLISQTISKLVSYKIQQYDKEIRELDRELKKFEQAHQMESSHFFRDFSEGKLGDDMDFVEWSSLWQMRQRLLEKRNELAGE